MLTREQIKIIATKAQTIDVNIAREYCQHLFLSKLYQLKESDKLLFKGGTALRLIFKSPRFSEDLDFTINDLSSSQIEDLVVAALERLDQEQLKVEIIEAKTTAGGYLAEFSCRWQDYNLALRLEASGRQKDTKKKDTKKSEVFTIDSEYFPTYSLVALPAEIMVGEKISAALTRQKPRDFFDVYFLLRARLILPKQKKLLTKVGDLLGKTKINFSQELKQFLPVSLHPLIKDFKKSLSQELQRGIAGKP